VLLVCATAVAFSGCGGDEADTAHPPQETDEPAGRGGALDVDRLAGNRSTHSPFVLVTVVNGQTDESRTAAIDYAALELAVAQERGIRGRAVADHLRSATSRRFVFKDPIALQNVWPTYSDAEVNEARTVLQGRTVEQIVQEQNRLDSDLNKLSQRNRETPYAYLRSVIQILLERGIYCGAACNPGLVFVE